MKKEIWDNIEKLSELRSNYSCFDEQEQPYYHALSLGIEGIKALEQDPILDKIRVKIENHCGLAKEDHCKYCSYCNSLMGVREILGIIDKYKAESENNNADSN